MELRNITRQTKSVFYAGLSAELCLGVLGLINSSLVLVIFSVSSKNYRSKSNWPHIARTVADWFLGLSAIFVCLLLFTEFQESAKINCVKVFFSLTLSYKSVLTLQLACRVSYFVNVWKMPRRRATSCEMSLLILLCLFASFWSTVIPFATNSFRNETDTTECGWAIYSDPSVYRSQTFFDLSNILLSLLVSVGAVIAWFWRVKKLLLHIMHQATSPAVDLIQRNVVRGVLAIISFELITALPTVLCTLLVNEYKLFNYDIKRASAFLFIPMMLQPTLRIFGILSLDSIFRQSLGDFLLCRIRLEPLPEDITESANTLAGKYSIASDIDLDAEETTNV